MNLKKISLLEMVIIIIFSIVICFSSIAAFVPAKSENRTNGEMPLNQKDIANGMAPVNSGETAGAPDIHEPTDAFTDNPQGVFVINNDGTIEALPGVKIIPFQSSPEDVPEFQAKPIIDYDEKEKISAVYQILPFNQYVSQLE